VTAFAHRVQVAQQSAEIELLMVAGVLVVGAAYLFWRSGRSWGSFTALGLALVALAAAFLYPSTTASPPVVPSSDPLISIIKPQPGERLRADEEVEVAVLLENAPMSDGGSLELLVDGRKRKSSTSSSRFRLRLAAGEHRLTVRYVPAVDGQIGPIETSVIVMAE
jgi:hypothetical protein